VAQTGHRAVQRRIDLLALEQNAWRLAALDARCVVVSSRTEIDWAMRQGQMIVWTPSKLILDSTDSPNAPARDGVALALWLAEHVAARELRVPEGVIVPPGSHVPHARLPR
jgi:7,8-dihydroneopterin aldolase/epimerase/oxygenase